MVTIRADFDLVGFEREAQDIIKKMGVSKTDIKNIAEIIIDDIRDGIDRGEGLSGSPFVSNTLGWIKRKGNTQTFLGKTGKLYSGIKITELTDRSFNIQVTSPGVNWQTNPGNKFGKLPQYKRDFFGISKRAFTKIKNYLNG